MIGAIAISVLVVAMVAAVVYDVLNERCRCRECDGVGQRWQHYGWGHYDFDAVECSTCGGTGRRPLWRKRSSTK
jgi:hypothetical protein